MPPTADGSVVTNEPHTSGLRRVLALYEPGRHGSAAIDLGCDLVERGTGSLTVVSVAPQDVAARCGRCCGSDPTAFNRAVADATAEELEQARLRLERGAESVTFTMLVEGVDPPLVKWVAEHGFELVLLPARRPLFGRARHPDAERLRAATAAEVQVVDPKARGVASTEASSRPLPTSG